MLEEIRKNIEQLVEDKHFLERRLEEINKQLAQETKALADIELIYKIFKEASQVSLKNLQNYLEDLVNQVLKVLFPDDKMKFKISFVESRGQIGCDISLQNEEGQDINIFDGGGGRLDVINLILRLAFLKIKANLPKLLIADEPLKHLDSERQEIIAKLVEDICEDLKIQLIMVTHNDAYVSSSRKARVIKIRRI